MKIYHYHPQTAEVLGTGTADPDPLTQGGWLIPAHATLLPPPIPGPEQAALFQGDAWAVVADQRGQTAYDLATGKAVTIDALGEIPASLTLQAPATEYDLWDEVAGAWVTDVVAKDDADARATLTRLDAKVPRGVEDLLTALETALSLDLRSHLPAETSAIIADKVTARGKLRN